MFVARARNRFPKESAMGFLRSTVSRVAGVGAVGLCAVAMSAMPASAATGTVSVSQHGAVIWSVTNPAATCYRVTGGSDSELFDIANGSNSKIYIYGSPQCNADPDTDLAPGGSLHNYFGVVSIRVDS
jgi:hypothetical protein